MQRIRCSRVLQAPLKFAGRIGPLAANSGALVLDCKAARDAVCWRLDCSKTDQVGGFLSLLTRSGEVGCHTGRWLGASTALPADKGGSMHNGLCKRLALHVAYQRLKPAAPLCIEALGWLSHQALSQVLHKTHVKACCAVKITSRLGEWIWRHESTASKRYSLFWAEPWMQLSKASSAGKHR